MARPIFRARRLLAASLLVVPPVALAALAGACGPQPTNAPAETTHPDFGDSSTTVVHDATVSKPPVDAGKDAAQATEAATDGPGDGGRSDSTIPDATPVDAQPFMDGAVTGAPCEFDVDCTSGVCGGGLDAAKLKGDGAIPCGTPAAMCICQPPTCNDGVKNGTETDVDCGGGQCPKCAELAKCVLGSQDCQSGVCGVGTQGGVCNPSDAGPGGCICEVPTCGDGVRNGRESSVDCGNSGSCSSGEGMCPTCAGCTTGKTCGNGGDCLSTSCNSNVCVCPTGMTEAPTSLHGPYCIDSEEVTYAQYLAFTNLGLPVTSQIPQCLWNTSFIPKNPGGSTYPVAYVNWCDAYAFCQANGKHLCGSINDKAKGVSEGDPIPIRTNDAGVVVTALDAGTDAGPAPSNDPNADEWYNACSGQGQYIYPYGNTFYPAQSTCNGGSPGDAGGGPVAAGSDMSCSGGIAPSLFDMSGNVAEWEDSCNGTSTGAAAAADLCALRGGSYNSVQPASLACASSAAQPPLARNTQAGNIGFRCCL